MRPAYRPVVTTKPETLERIADLRGPHPNVTDLGGARYQPTLRIVAKGDKSAEVPLNPRTQQAIAEALDGRVDGPLLLNQWSNRMPRHNAAAIVAGRGIRGHRLRENLREGHFGLLQRRPWSGPRCERPPTCRVVVGRAVCPCRHAVPAGC